MWPNQLTNQLIDRLIGNSMNEWMNEWINQSINQSIKWRPMLECSWQARSLKLCCRRGWDGGTWMQSNTNVIVSDKSGHPDSVSVLIECCVMAHCAFIRRKDGECYASIIIQTPSTLSSPHHTLSIWLFTQIKSHVSEMPTDWTTTSVIQISHCH